MKRFTDKPGCTYDLSEIPAPFIRYRIDFTNGRTAEPPADLKWSGDAEPPKIGERVTTKLNRLGRGVVESYFVEHGWLGVCVVLDDPPDWKKKQHKGTEHERTALLFGIDLP